MKTEAYWRNVANQGRNMSFRDLEFSPAKGSSIWQLAPILAAMSDPRVAIEYSEDFVACPVDDTTFIPDGWHASGDHKTTTFPKLGGGVIDLECGNTDNDEYYLGLGGGGSATHAPFVITDANNKPLFFEAYVKALEHADEGAFVGLTEENCAAADLMADNTMVIADKDAIGFRLLQSSPAEWDVYWRKAGQAAQEVANVVANADDWHRFAFWFDGLSTVTFYVDDTAVSTTATTSAATFPSAQALSPLVGLKTGEGVTKHLQVDYIRILQVR